MFLVFVVVWLSYFGYAFGENIQSLQRYCSNFRPQEHIDISQLTGIWYGVEIISHIEERRPENYVKQEHPDTQTCVGVVISDRYNSELYPNYKNYYQQPYGRGYLTYNTQEPQTEYYYSTTEYNINRNDRNRQLDQKYRERVYKQYEERKPIVLNWDEDGKVITYTAYYIMPHVGQWYLYGPSNDSYAHPGMSNFIAGNVQVLKAVGNHLVLTFCHRFPEEKLYTIILSRYPKLNQQEISGVHNLLNRRELHISRPRKLCLSSGSKKHSVNFVLIFLGLMYTFAISS